MNQLELNHKTTLKILIVFSGNKEYKFLLLIASNSIKEYNLQKPFIAPKSGRTQELLADEKLRYLINHENPILFPQKNNFLFVNPDIAKCK